MRKHRFAHSGPDRTPTSLLWALSLGLLLAVPIVGFSQKLHKFDNLTEAVYFFEVTLYCGLATDAVIRGYHYLEDDFRRTHHLISEEMDEQRGKGWSLAHAEWQNRGLGGFRAWCATEGREAADTLSSFPPPA